MPKITEDIEESEDEDEQFEEDEELEQAPKRKGKPIQAPSPARVGLPRNIQPPQSQAPKRRFGVIAAQPVKIVDTEAEEVLGEGEYLIAQVLADIVERLERIENTIGSIAGGN